MNYEEKGGEIVTWEKDYQGSTKVKWMITENGYSPIEIIFEAKLCGHWETLKGEPGEAPIEHIEVMREHGNALSLPEPPEEPTRFIP